MLCSLCHELILERQDEFTLFYGSSENIGALLNHTALNLDYVCKRVKKFEIPDHSTLLMDSFIRGVNRGEISNMV